MLIKRRKQRALFVPHTVTRALHTHAHTHTHTHTHIYNWYIEQQRAFDFVRVRVVFERKEIKVFFVGEKHIRETHAANCASQEEVIGLL